ncbi:phage integrase SAM-like domain-containing protein [Streptomyces flavochromogenes]|jgi:integrase|uniref:phage integrase SAM-like domain-containing protein n=1 Tax=Streptomyces flavochromogenes TaxID=68199 RepID=UPI00131B7C81|nr:phage integrase SAM-like domain-containing protein [Streptomyces flavochromogenes]
MAGFDQHVHVEWRGSTCRVKWWAGDHLPNGRKRYESKGGFTDEDSAYRHGQDKLYEIRHGTHVSNRDGATPVSDWADSWFESLDLRHLSIRNYKWRVAHIKAFFKQRPVSELTIMDHRSFKKYLAAVPLGAKSQTQILSTFATIMDDAVKAGLIKQAPIERQGRRGKFERKPRERKHDMAVESVARLAHNADIRWGLAGFVYVWTMAMTGMRPAELYGLTREYCYPHWPKTDLRQDESEVDRYADDLLRYGADGELLPAIRVERQVQYENGILSLHPPKYDSFRTLVVPPFLAGLLEALLASHESPWVFPAIEGGSLGAASFNKEYWRPVADGAPASGGPKLWREEMPPVQRFVGKRQYLVRHGHKEWLDEDGHPRFAVEARMGHELAGVEGTYSNLTVAMEQGIMRSLQARWEALPAALRDRPVRDKQVVQQNAVGSITALVRQMLAEGVTEPDAIVAGVEAARPGSQRNSVLQARRRLLADA